MKCKKSSTNTFAVSTDRQSKEKKYASSQLENGTEQVNVYE